MIHVDQDAARIMRDLAADKLASREPEVTVGVGVPEDWAPADGDHVQVDTDGGPTGPAATWHTIRVTAWSEGRSRAVDLANLTRALLLAHDGSGGIHRPRPGIATTSVRDTRTSAYLAGFTITVPIRPRPIS